MSSILEVLFFFIKSAIPLACDEKLLKIHFPSHSSLTDCSMFLLILESVTMMKSAFFFAKKVRIFLRFGLRPILFALKQIILNLDAELSPPPTVLLSDTAGTV